MKTTLPVVTLDGPAGVGKTTLAQQLAESLHVAYLDTGAMFRCLALKLGPGAETLPEEELREKCRQWTFSLSGKGRASAVCCNGVPILCKGSNWVPLDALHSRDEGRYDRAMALMADMGCNIVRCWGGNVVEDHHFFHLWTVNTVTSTQETEEFTPEPFFPCHRQFTYSRMHLQETEMSRTWQFVSMRLFTRKKM